MPEDSDCLARLSRLNLGLAPHALERLAGDASTRTYYRAHFPDGSTAMLMLMPHPGMNEESSFLDVQHFLERRGLPVPRIYAHHCDEGVVVLEDLGDDLLEDVADRAEEAEILSHYREAVDILVSMRRRTGQSATGCGAFDLAFDEEKLMAEMDFFLTHFVRGLCKADLSAEAELTLGQFFIRICSSLAAEPRIFAHRDYHARNLILHGGRLVMIDFQDARMGPAQYDLASLLRDSYVTLPEEMLDELLRYYLAAVEDLETGSQERFRFVFDLMSLQRNIKALGTFGYQLSVRGSRRYASSVPRTATYIARNIARYSELAAYRSVVEDYITGPALTMT